MRDEVEIAFLVACQRLAEQRFLVAEGGVQGRPFDAGSVIDVAGGIGI